MKLVFRFQCAIAALMLVFGAFSIAQGQAASATPDPFVAQLTSSPINFSSFAGDITGNGRFVVFDSNGNLDTQNPRNADGNREIFILDYAQRRIFQITNTKNVQKLPASPTPTPTATPTPTPGATPTPTPLPTPADPAQIKIEISSSHPAITFEPALMAGKRTYTIVFGSNAPNPSNFDGTDSDALVADGNQEIWIYQLPEIDDTFDLTTGDDLPLTDLTTGTFRQVTTTPPSRPLRTGVNPPDIIDDNRDIAISDNGTTLAFISTRNLVAPGNADLNPELFLLRTTGGFAAVTNTVVQATTTQDTVPGISNTLQQNPSLSADGSVVAFLSRANLATDNPDLREEVFVADFTGSAVNNFRQITKTKPDTGINSGISVNLLSAGRRLSRDGKFVAYQSRAVDPASNNGTNSPFLAPFVSDVPPTAATASTAKLVGPRAPETSQVGDIINFPVFSDYDGSLAPHSIVWASALNFKPDGTFPSEAEDSTGLNSAPSGTVRPTQIFSTQIPITTSNTFTRLTKVPPLGLVGIRPLVSNTRKRIAFTMQGIELGGGNADQSPEVFYLLSPSVTTDSGAVLSFFTGASNMGPFSSANPSPSPTPTPSPSPGIPTGLAPGELSIVRSTVGLATSDKNGVGGSETGRSPILPIELNGVSLAVGGAAAGLYFVGDTPAEGISFVMPKGLFFPTTQNVVINDQRNNGGTVFRAFLSVLGAQPDIFTSTNDAGGIAMVCNVTNTAVSGCVTGPFQVTTADSTGTQVPTKLEIYLTGARFAGVTETKVTFINGTTLTDITPTSVRVNSNMFGTDLINITLPATLAGMAPIDYKLLVTVTKSGVVTTSRPEATAPTVTIIP